MKHLATMIRLTAALLLAPALAHADGMADLGKAVVKNSADAASGAAKKTAQDEVTKATGDATGKAAAAAAPAADAKAKAEAVHKNANDTKDSVEGLGNALKGMGN